MIVEQRMLKKVRKKAGENAGRKTGIAYTSVSLFRFLGKGKGYKHVLKLVNRKFMMNLIKYNYENRDWNNMIKYSGIATILYCIN